MKLAHCQHTRMGRITLSGDQLLQRQMHMHPDVDGIDPCLRISAVTASPCDRDPKTVHRIHHRSTGIVHKQPHRHPSWGHMIRQCPVHMGLLQNSVRNHIPASLKGLFRRLEHEFHRSL